MPTLTIRLDLSQADDPRSQAARCLDHVAVRLTDSGATSSLLYDVYGDPIGSWELSGESEARSDRGSRQPDTMSVVASWLSSVLLRRRDRSPST